ncbi:MAG: adenylosuccinate lyase [Burkholderiales bacterium]
MTMLRALSPLDGRYQPKVAALSDYFSEYALIRYRLRIEIAWLQALAHDPAIPEVTPFSEKTLAKLNSLVNNFSEADAQGIKDIEARVNHDVKALEYWLKERLKGEIAVEFIHFACTSEDINNLCYALMFSESRSALLLPKLTRIIAKLTQMAHEYAALPMLSRTHGQAATPTTVGKELANFAYRLQRQRRQLANLTLTGKMNGAVGCYNAHLAAYPQLDWEKFAKSFVEKLGLEFNPYTTQIEPHDTLAELFQCYFRINSILLDLNRDLWGYISLAYFTQKVDENEVGSSTMPHKVNPIDFENSEGNLGLANALFSHLSEKLPVSRWQRDLSDSTVLRNAGMALGYTLLAFDSCAQGLAKLDVNRERLSEDLEANWEVLAEAIQTSMRRFDVPNAYERMKELTRGKRGIDRETLHAFIESLAIPEHKREHLLKLTPASYIGLAATLAKRIGND